MYVAERVFPRTSVSRLNSTLASRCCSRDETLGWAEWRPVCYNIQPGVAELLLLWSSSQSYGMVLCTWVEPPTVLAMDGIGWQESSRRHRTVEAMSWSFGRSPVYLFWLQESQAASTMATAAAVQVSSTTIARIAPLSSVNVDVDTGSTLRSRHISRSLRLKSKKDLLLCFEDFYKLDFVFTSLLCCLLLP